MLAHIVDTLLQPRHEGLVYPRTRLGQLVGGNGNDEGERPAKTGLAVDDLVYAWLLQFKRQVG